MCLADAAKPIASRAKNLCRGCVGHTTVLNRSMRQWLATRGNNTPETSPRRSVNSPRATLFVTLASPGSLDTLGERPVIMGIATNPRFAPTSPTQDTLES